MFSRKNTAEWRCVVSLKDSVVFSRKKMLRDFPRSSTGEAIQFGKFVHAHIQFKIHLATHDGEFCFS